ncbi:predicted protein [Histoplasma mississippiense (nom. inval.)]|uniref:predicted protein n=1 Tax=Ajellomyces capsulatus (strain NAm1 / WU24) TaxID=2059318 RepID=UPI000157BE6C|nr:predicted protein [Histoplasma mississippiense (nom. inval.)]EDN06926.1 predicted protein [Histoplasma mississippiense (nom. inval.)]
MASFFLISLRAQLMTAFFEYFIGQLLQHCCGPWLEPNSVLITVGFFAESKVYIRKNWSLSEEAPIQGFECVAKSTSCFNNTLRFIAHQVARLPSFYDSGFRLQYAPVTLIARISKRTANTRTISGFIVYSHETAETGFQERTEPGLGYGRGDKVSTVVTVHVFLLGLDKLKTLYRIICAPKEPRKGTPPEYFGTLADVLGPFPLLVSADRACPTRKGFPSQEFAVEDICLDVGYQLVMGHNVQNQQQIR